MPQKRKRAVKRLPFLRKYIIIYMNNVSGETFYGMEILFFDIECANNFNGAGKICEFGYVLTDGDFNIIDKDEILVNPRSQFDWYVLKKMLTYRRGDYLAAPAYPKVYPRIKALFDRGPIVVGHTVDADAKYLNDESARYNLPMLNYKFYDAMQMFVDGHEGAAAIGLEKMGEVLGTARPEHAHRSMDDAEATMLTVKKMCRDAGTDIAGLIERSPDCYGETADGKIDTVIRKKAMERRAEREREKNTLHGERLRHLIGYARRYKPQGEIVECALTGKTVCVSMNYQYDHCRETFGLVSLLKQRGCNFTERAEKCDVFVPYVSIKADGTERECKKLARVREARAAGRDIEIVSFERLMELLGESEENLPEYTDYGKKTGPRRQGA